MREPIERGFLWNNENSAVRLALLNYQSKRLALKEKKGKNSLKKKRESTSGR